MHTPELLFAGRATVDLTVRVPYRPSPGGTAFAESLTITAGGKSLNQAVAAARQGGRVALVAKAGTDAWGDLLAEALFAAGVDTRAFTRLPGVTTSAAIVEITPDGDNSVVLAPSAEAELTAEDLDRALARFADAAVVVQLDQHPATLAGIAKLPPDRLVIGNLVPRPPYDTDVLRRLDVFAGNRQEAGELLAVDSPDPLTAARRLRELGPAAAVVTAGPDGAAYSYSGGDGTIAAPPAAVVDTVGAGDAFLGRLALDLARGATFEAAVALAVRAGTAAVQHPGPIA